MEIIGLLVGIVLYFAFIAAICALMFWKIFTKAGEAGWKSMIPIYNAIILLKIVGRPSWWFILYFIPVVNLIIAILVAIDLAKSFGKSTGFAIGLIFLAPIFYLILGFGDATYQGPAAPSGAAVPATA